MANPKDIGIRITRLRREAGLSVKEAAKALHVGDALFYRWACGDAFPGYLNLLELSNLFNVSLDYLAGREPGQR